MGKISSIVKIDIIKEIYNKLQDEESKEIYEKRLNCILPQNADEFCQWFIKCKKNLYCPELDIFEKDNSLIDGYILFGAGYEGKIIKKILEACGRKVVAWCDNNSAIWGKQIDGVKVITPSELITDYANYFIIISTKAATLEIYRQLLGMEIKRNRIFISQNERILAFTGNQYFDIFDANREGKEVFIDGGGYNLETSLEFIRWSNNNYKKIFVFEPDKFCFDKCLKKIKDCCLENIELINCGLWSKRDELYFSSNGRGSSRINEGGDQKIKLISIDELLKDEEVTFIKLDIEGSELEALKGAKKIIVKNRPRLAICIYHKMEDLWEIPEYILRLVPDYKLYIRHYTTYLYETVLYAI